MRIGEYNVILVSHVPRDDQSPGKFVLCHRFPRRVVYLPRDGSTSPVMRVGSVVEGVELGFSGVHIPHMEDLWHNFLIALHYQCLTETGF